MVEGLRSGEWVTAVRVRRICLLLLATTILCYAALLATAHGTLDSAGRPIGTDFSDVYAAGRMALDGHAAAAWHWDAHYQVQQAIHRSATVPFYGWHYPPPFLLIAAALALLPYMVALAVWQGMTLAMATLVARTIVPGKATTLAVLAAPVTFVCLGHGQNAFLTAALLGGGLLLLDGRSWLAGLLLGALVYKPQFAVLLPVVLLAAGNRRAFTGAALSSLCIIAATLAIWGWPVWEAFRASLAPTRTIVIEQGGTGWEKIVTTFAAVRMLGASIPFGYAAQGLSTALSVIGAGLAARYASAHMRGATVCAAALLSTPYALDYDLVILGGALCFLVADARARGWLSWEKSLLALAYLIPLTGRQLAAFCLVPFDWLTVVAVFALAMRRSWRLDGAALYDQARSRSSRSAASSPSRSI